jgi:dTDP-4-amino-4,6-dideoxygalactose transaminase
VPVHYGGIACDMDAICALARDRGLAVVEDNAHGLFASYKGRPLGSFGALATQSFHETKNFSCGEGGALVINDRDLVDRAEIIREKGTNRRRFLRGEIDKYSWVDVGSSYLPSEILAAVLLAQLEKRAEIQARRRAIWLRYDERLRPVAERSGLTLPTVPAGCEQAYHLYWLLARSPAQRTALLAHLKNNGVAATFHYVPLHLSEMGRKLGARPGDCPVAESAADRLLRVPLHLELTEADQDRVVEVLAAGLTAA